MSDGGFKAPPVTGYNDQNQAALDTVNQSKVLEMRVASFWHNVMSPDSGLEPNPQWMNIAKTHFEEGFMALNRAIFKPDNPF